MDILSLLKNSIDSDYAIFHSALVPGISRESILGVRVPEIRKIAKTISGTKETSEFINALPHRYYDENMLHSVLLCAERDYDICIREIESFLPYIDNWAVCDALSPKVFKHNKKDVMSRIPYWVVSEHTYTCRFGIKMIMDFFLDDDFKPEYLELVSAVHRDEYYIQMMQAWFFATALAKQWDSTIPYIENEILDRWVHNKTIQKARESYRISDEQKEYLKRFRIDKNKQV